MRPGSLSGSLSRIATLVALVALLWPASVHAYLIDANDANTVDPGTVEMEIQPVGYYATLGDESERYLLTPSTMLYVGLVEGFDLILIGRGYLLLNGDGNGNDYSFTETGGYVRAMLRDGSYWGDESGPSITLQAGVFLPTYNDGGSGLGGSVALLLSQAWEGVTVHANVQIDHRGAAHPGFFGALVVEGDTRWRVRPTAEVYVDFEGGGGGSIVSGLVGVMADLSDRFQVSAGLRVAGGSAGREMEARLSTWFVLGGREGGPRARAVPSRW